MNNTFSELYNEFMVYAEKGDEAGAKQFLLDNFNKFPEELQDKLTFVFFEEALASEAEKVRGVAEIQKEGLEAMSQLEKMKKSLEEQIKVLDIKEDLDK